MEHFAAMPLSNSSVLCVGSITRRETLSAQEDGIQVDGYGYYLFVADESEPKKPIQILAKVATQAAAEKLARLFSAQWAMVA